MAGADLVRENSTVGWLADKSSEHNWFLGTNNWASEISKTLGCMDHINFYGMLESLEVLEEI